MQKTTYVPGTKEVERLINSAIAGDEIAIAKIYRIRRYGIATPHDDEGKKSLERVKNCGL